MKKRPWLGHLKNSLSNRARLNVKNENKSHGAKEWGSAKTNNTAKQLGDSNPNTISTWGNRTIHTNRVVHCVRNQCDQIWKNWATLYSIVWSHWPQPLLWLSFRGKFITLGHRVRRVRSLSSSLSASSEMAQQQFFQKKYIKKGLT